MAAQPSGATLCYIEHICEKTAARYYLAPPGHAAGVNDRRGVVCIPHLLLRGRVSGFPATYTTDEVHTTDGWADGVHTTDRWEPAERLCKCTGSRVR